MLTVWIGGEIKTAGSRGSPADGNGRASLSMKKLKSASLNAPYEPAQRNQAGETKDKSCG